MVFKKIAVLCFFLFLGLVSADSIDNVTVRSNVPLNEFLTVNGLYSNVDGNSGVLCSFKIFDQQTLDKYLIFRLSDEYTFSDGTFSTDHRITEPIFQRGFDYNLFVCCNTACYNESFYVEQTDEIAFGKTAGSLTMDLAFWTNPNNSFTAFWMLFIFLMVVFVLVNLSGQNN